ncbi:MAG: hypothetical protein ACLR8U_09065 [Oscillospiraceae bacterium]
MPVTIDEAALAGLDQDSSVVGLQVGEQITLEDLLYCMMVTPETTQQTP